MATVLMGLLVGAGAGGAAGTAARLFALDWPSHVLARYAAPSFAASAAISYPYAFSSRRKDQDAARFLWYTYTLGGVAFGLSYLSCYAGTATVIGLARSIARRNARDD